MNLKLQNLNREAKGGGMSQNFYTFQILNPGSTKNKTPTNKTATKKIQNYSYSLSDQIGLGFTSHVYRGRCDLTNKQVAVKVIQLKSTEEDDLQAGFLKQQVAALELIKNADSTNLLKLQKVIQSKNHLYIITEFCQGNDMAKILRKKKLFNQIEAHSVMKQLLNGYKQLYKLGIVHRDLKLANLFISKGKLKIADFGFAVSERQCRIIMDYNVGSPYYMAPEALKKNEYSYQSDVWAIGVIAYQIVYGVVPWKDKDDRVLYQMINSNPIEQLFDNSKQVSDYYKSFIKSCLTVDRRLRAIPQYVINYQWPYAQQYVEGLDDTNKFRHSVGVRNSLPLISMQKPNLRNIMNNDQNVSVDNKFLRKRTPSMDNLRKLTKNEEQFAAKAPPLKNQNPISKSYIQQPQKFIIRQSSQQKYSKNDSRLQSKNHSRHSRQSNSRQMRDSETQKGILGQIHFCRFLYQLYKILKSRFQSNNQMQKITTQLAAKVSQKIGRLVKIAQTQNNMLSCPDFQSYVKSKRWDNLKQIIYRYDLSYRELITLNEVNTIKFEVNSQLVPAIRQLKINIGANTKILELLVYFYQLKQYELATPAHQLQQKLKLQYLVDQCIEYSEGLAHKKTQVEISQNIDRLLKKMQLLGL